MTTTHNPSDARMNEKKKYFVVLNQRGGEGFITDSESDAEYAATGFSGGCMGVSCVAEAFRDSYGNDQDDDEDEFDEPNEFGIRTVEITVSDHDPDACVQCSSNEPCADVVPEVSDLTDALAQIADELGCEHTLPDMLEAIADLRAKAQGIKEPA